MHVYQLCLYHITGNDHCIALRRTVILWFIRLPFDSDKVWYIRVGIFYSLSPYKISHVGTERVRGIWGPVWIYCRTMLIWYIALIVGGNEFCKNKNYKCQLTINTRINKVRMIKYDKSSNKHWVKNFIYWWVISLFYACCTKKILKAIKN